MEKKELLDFLNNKIAKNNLLETLQIVFTGVNGHQLSAQMPVNPKVHQPMGLLHGGATAALAESVGSTASHIVLGREDIEIRGIELSINHLRSKKEGIVTATAKPIHLGRTTHLWEIIITDEKGKMIAHAKLTNIVLSKK
jgi:uncharacterized protein (TIGR00369 family)